MTNRHIISRSIPIPERNWEKIRSSKEEDDDENGNDLAALLAAMTKTSDAHDHVNNSPAIDERIPALLTMLIADASPALR